MINNSVVVVSITGRQIYTTDFVVARTIFFVILFLLIAYFLLSLFFKGKKRTITIIDKWIKWSSDLAEQAGELGTYIVVYQNQQGTTQKWRLAYCLEYVYDEFEIGKTYLVLQKFKTIKEVYEEII